MPSKNSCYTYFEIIGKFPPEEITRRLGLDPQECRRAGDLRKNGTAHEEASWTYGRCDDYDVDTGVQMRKTIADLLDKIDALNAIRADYDVRFFLEVVPSLYCGEIAPCLAPPPDVIDFCHATRTEMDIDLYLYEMNDQEN